MSSIDQIYEEFRKACDEHPELAPLKPLADLDENNQLTNFDVFKIKDEYIQHNVETRQAYDAEVPKGTKEVALSLVQAESEPSLESLVAESPEDAELFGGAYMNLPSLQKSYIRDGRISAPVGMEQLNKIEPAISPSYALLIHQMASAEGATDVLEGDGKPMRRVKGSRFWNWGLTVDNTPSDTFSARTRIGVQNLVKWAKQNNKRVRVAGFRHTWGNFFSQNDEVVVALLPLETTTELPYHPNFYKDSDLQGVNDVTPPSVDGTAERWVRVASGTTNDQFRRWCLENKTLALPLNVIMVEITFGGSNGPVCHGAGITTKTLSDLVVAVEYVDPNGDIKFVDDPEQIKAAAGSFGLLGIVISLTLRVDKMMKAVMVPRKVPIQLAIPPPEGYKVPDQIKKMKKVTPEQLKKAQADFEKTVQEDYYVEWFWFPYCTELWVNTWKKAPIDAEDKLKPYPSNYQANLQWYEAWTAQQLVNSRGFRWLSGATQAWTMGKTTMSQMPSVKDEKHAIQTYVSEALHFRRGIQNMRVLDMEWEIPIPAVKGGTTRDYSVIQRAWWDGLTAFYDNIKKCPMRLALEMRLTGDSNVTLAPQRHNGELGTISIEVLTIPTTPAADWKQYKQEMIDKWTSYRDNTEEGNLLNARPHWAKEWQGLNVRGMDIMTYLKTVAYKKEIPEFVGMLDTITKKNGTTLEESRKRFSNPLLEELFFC